MDINDYRKIDVTKFKNLSDFIEYKRNVNTELYNKYFKAIKDQSSDSINMLADLQRQYDMDQGIVNKSFTETKKKMTKEDFVNSLTKTEKKAFEFLLTKLSNGEGVVSISQLILETNISRPVFKNLLSKMGEVAEINNLGVKGTYIKIYNHS